MKTDHFQRRRIKYALAITVMMVSMMWASGDGADGILCTQTEQASDNSCNTWPNSCVIDHGCTGYPFRAACSGTYLVDAWIFCTGSTPDPDCASCVFVTLEGSQQHLVDCSTTEICVNGGTTKSCTVILTAGQNYVLHVCLVPCPDQNPGCPPNGDCHSGCEAHGCVRYAQTAPCW